MKKKISFEQRVNVCFGAYGVRCIYGKELDEDILYRTGRAMVEYLKCKEIIVGRDMRTSSKGLSKSFIKGVNDSGADVINIGLVDTPSIYFASGFYKKPGAMITASHNPAKFNGVKLVKKGALPIGQKTGLKQIKKLVEKESWKKNKKKGNVTNKNIFRDYKKHVFSFIDKKAIKGMKVVIDAGNGMAGKIVPIIYKGLDIKIIPLDFRLDGSFPTHQADPSKQKNIRDLKIKVLEKKADFGIAFDGDVDRVFFVDENGKSINSSITASLLIKHFSEKRACKSIVHTLTCSKIIDDTARKYCKKVVIGKVGHSFIKDKMKKSNSEFGCEHSGHFYYKDNYYADSAIISSLLVCETYSRKNKKFSDLVKEFRKYHKSEEKNINVKDKQKIILEIENKYKKKAKKIIKTDGLTMEFKDFWFNVRLSNTEQFLRVNIESDSYKRMIEERKELLNFIKSKK